MSVRPEISAAMGVKHTSEDTRLLERSINSVLEQRFPYFELLICIKESSKKTVELLKEAAMKDDRIKILDGSGCNHLGGQLNLCIKSAKGEYIARMDDDDFAYPQRLEKQLEYLRTHPGTAFVGSQVRLMRDGVEAGKRDLPQQPQINDFLFVQPYIHPTLMFRRSALEAVGGYSDEKNQRGCEDYDLLLRLYEKGFSGANLNETLLDYTLPPKGKTHRSFSLRMNETKTRFKRFSSLGLMPKAFPYAVKPIAVGLLPIGLLEFLKVRRYGKNDGRALDYRK